MEPMTIALPWSETTRRFISGGIALQVCLVLSLLLVPRHTGSRLLRWAPRAAVVVMLAAEAAVEARGDDGHSDVIGGIAITSNDQIAEELRCAPSNVTQLSDQLEKKGLAERRPQTRQGLTQVAARDLFRFLRPEHLFHAR